MASEYVYDPWW